MEAGLTIGEMITATVGFLAIVSFFWKSVGGPNSKQNQEIALLKMARDQDTKDRNEMKANIDKTSATLNVILINHLPHIQKELTELRIILDERLPRKSKQVD